MIEIIKYSRTREILSTIIAFLATAQGDMRNRLTNLVVEIGELCEDDFPDKLKKDWKFIEDKLTKYPEKYNWNKTRIEMGSFEHSLSRMQNRTACKIAEKLYQLYEAMFFGEYKDLH